MRIAGNPAADVGRIEMADVHVIRRALEEAGVEFIDENGSGPGIRPREGTPSGLAE
jgi:hypothetical protein